MERYGAEPYRSAISGAFSRLPPGIYDRVAHVHFLCGVDPIWVGFTRFSDVSGGRSVRNTAHVSWIRHQLELPADRRHTTIVLPTERDVNLWTVYHEIGHVLHEATGYADLVEPVTEYATTNNVEAFAEAFCSWRWPPYAGKDLRAVDPAVNAFFELLADGR